MTSLSSADRFKEGQMHLRFYTAESICSLLDEFGLSYQRYYHEPIMTVADGEHLRDIMPGMHTRNMFLKDKLGLLVLVTLPDNMPIDLKKMSKLLECKRFSFGSPALLLDVLGVTPGSVTPLSIFNDQKKKVRLVLDKTMMSAEIINVHPLINTQTIGLRPADFLKLLAKFDIKPHIVDLNLANYDFEVYESTHEN